MAATTTIASGFLMLPSSVLAYIQIGVFLVVAMSISWIFSTFFLMSLLSLCGPQFGFGQLSLSYPRFNGNRSDSKTIKNQIDKINNTIQQQSSEQLLSASSSAACEFLESETHLEMDSLSNSVVVKTISLDSSTTIPSISSMRPTSFDRSFRKMKNFVKDTSPSTNSTVTVCQEDIDADFYKI
jgi:protein dispatched 1